MFALVIFYIGLPCLTDHLEFPYRLEAHLIRSCSEIATPVY